MDRKGSRSPGLLALTSLPKRGMPPLEWGMAPSPDGSLLTSFGEVMALTQEQIAQQQKQAEELLFSGPQTLGFAKGLFFGHFNAPLLFPYPVLKPEEQAEVDRAAREVRDYCDKHIDA